MKINKINGIGMSLLVLMLLLIPFANACGHEEAAVEDEEVETCVDVIVADLDSGLVDLKVEEFSEETPSETFTCGSGTNEITIPGEYILNCNDKELDIKGDNVKIIGGGSGGMSVSGKGVEISGGTISGADNGVSVSGELTISGNAKITGHQGVIVLNGGDVTISGNAKITGNEVGVFVFNGGYAKILGGTIQAEDSIVIHGTVKINKEAILKGSVVSARNDSNTITGTGNYFAYRFASPGGEQYVWVNDELLKLLGITIEEEILTGILSGIVWSDGDPLSGVVVTLTDCEYEKPCKGLGKTATTDEDGEYIISDTPLDDYTVSFIKEGYELSEKIANLNRLKGDGWDMSTIPVTFLDNDMIPISTEEDLPINKFTAGVDFIFDKDTAEDLGDSIYKIESSTGDFALYDSKGGAGPTVYADDATTPNINKYVLNSLQYKNYKSSAGSLYLSAYPNVIKDAWNKAKGEVGEIPAGGVFTCKEGEDNVIDSPGEYTLDCGDEGVTITADDVKIVGGNVGWGITLIGKGVEIKGGTITGKNSGVSVYDEGTVEISGDAKIIGRFNGVFVRSGTAIISGGTITGRDDGVFVRGGTATISGGTITGRDGGVFVRGGTVTISGGTITGGEYGVSVRIGIVEISGGTIDGLVNSYNQDNIEGTAGYELAKNSDGSDKKNEDGFYIWEIGGEKAEETAEEELFTRLDSSVVKLKSGSTADKTAARIKLLNELRNLQGEEKTKARMRILQKLRE